MKAIWDENRVLGGLYDYFYGFSHTTAFTPCRLTSQGFTVSYASLMLYQLQQGRVLNRCYENRFFGDEPWPTRSFVCQRTMFAITNSMCSFSAWRRREQDISLIVDGGSENNNRHVQALLDTVPMKKLIAQVDVSFSNSMIEAVNKTLKYRYLFRKPIGDLDHLQTAIALAVTDYNARPHYALQGLTPDEAYRGMVFNEKAYRDRLQKAREKRLLENRKTPHPCHPWEGEDNAVLEIRGQGVSV